VAPDRSGIGAGVCPEESSGPSDDSRLLEIARAKIVQVAKRVGIALKQTFMKEGRELRRKAGGYILLEDVGRLPKEVVVDLGFRGIDDDNPKVEIIHRGKYKSLTKQQRRWLKRRQAVEPAIGHLKSDHRMDRCWLQGQLGDARHAVLCATGYNLRWLLRAMARLGLSAVLLRPLLRVLRPLFSGNCSRSDSIIRSFRLVEVIC